MDTMVLKTQEWLNATYGNDSRFGSVPENGNTGWTTIYSLIRALQIELGINTLANNFGPTTISKFNARFPNGVQQQESGATQEDNIYAIIQGALWCKGYSTGSSSITKHFYSGTGSAVKHLKSDMGFESPDSSVTLNVMKALLSMDQFVMITSQGGTSQIRSIQQKLNQKYESYIGIIPCDGIYGRTMNKALIYVLQAIEGLSVSQANGNFGPTTQSKLPLLPDTSNMLTDQQVLDACDLVRYALVCNGIEDIDLTPLPWNSALANTIGRFQSMMALPITNSADKNTWMSLLLSKGNPDRAAKACDTRFEMTPDRLRVLKEQGYEIVGRYLTGTTFKVLRDEEPARIFDAGMKLFLIFQESGSDISYFTTEQGKLDAYAAVKAARKLRLPEGSFIFFATDLDPQDTQITSTIIPYFESLKKHFDAAFKLGVYGTRNTCSRLSKADLTEASFVSDMSIGYSGNMGFAMPGNWCYDQFAEISMSDDWSIDKDAYSENFPAISSLSAEPPYIQPAKPQIPEGTPFILDSIENWIETLENLYYDYYLATHTEISPTLNADIGRIIATGITNYLRRFKYHGIQWVGTTDDFIDTAFVAYVEDNNSSLASQISTYIIDDSHLITDNDEGLLDLSHLCATLECYMNSTLPIPDWWAGWGGDLATGMAQTTAFLQAHPDVPVQETADFIICRSEFDGEARFNYSDVCADADAIKLGDMIRNEFNSNVHALSTALRKYYSGMHQNRYEYYLMDLACPQTLTALKVTISLMMSTADGLLLLKGDNPTEEILYACCKSFANYLYCELQLRN